MFSSAATAVQDDGIIDIHLPLNTGAATNARDKLAAAGMKVSEADEFVPMLLAIDSGDSRPITLTAENGKTLCLAVTWKDDALKTMRFSKSSISESELSILAFMAAHERAHCKELLADETAASKAMIGDSMFWRSESKADALARQAVHALGKSGSVAAEAWRTRRLFDFMAGDIQHWTTPIVDLIESTGDITESGVEKAFDALGGEKGFADLTSCWRSLLSALFAGDDRSQEQALAWTQAVAKLPTAARSSLPELDDIRKAAIHAWPSSNDWRLEATGRSLPFKLKRSFSH